MSPLPVYHFEGHVPVSGDKRFLQGYLQHPFDVPEGTGEVRLRLQFGPRKVNGVSNLITLGVFDPHGFRGNAHRNPPDAQVVLSAAAATPGFVPGPLPAGQWLAQLALHAILASDPPCSYTLDIELAAQASQPAAVRDNPGPAQPAASGPGWYRGELHSHTNHSDGSLTPAQLIDLAHQEGLDFLAITDHNTTTTLAAVDPAELNGLVLIPGFELTTFTGHALALGITDWVDWRTGYDGWTIEAAARAVHALGGLFIIAHPQDIPNPICTGCRWEYTDFDLDLADGIEIWNGRWWESNLKNPKNLQLWQGLQAKARRMPITSGSDLHSAASWGEGSPRVYIHAEQLTAPALLDGIRHGRMLLSSGPFIELEAAIPSGARAAIGETLPAAGQPVSLALRWQGAPRGAQLALMGACGQLAVLPAEGAGAASLPFAPGSGERCWLQLTAADETLLAITNPLFIEA